MDGSEGIHENEEGGPWTEGIHENEEGGPWSEGVNDYGEDFADYELIGEEVNEKPTPSILLKEIDEILNSSTEGHPALQPKANSTKPVGGDSYADAFTQFNEENNVDDDGYHTINIHDFNKVKQTSIVPSSGGKSNKITAAKIETQLVTVKNSNKQSSIPRGMDIKTVKPSQTSLGDGWRNTKDKKAALLKAVVETKLTTTGKDVTTSPWVIKKGCMNI